MQTDKKTDRLVVTEAFFLLMEVLVDKGLLSVDEERYIYTEAANHLVDKPDNDEGSVKLAVAVLRRLADAQ